MAASKQYRVLAGWVLYVEEVAFGEGEVLALSPADAKRYLDDGAVEEA